MVSIGAVSIAGMGELASTFNSLLRSSGSFGFLGFFKFYGLF